MRIYDFESYRSFLISVIQVEIDRGIKGRLAKAAGCSPSWITRVFAGEVHLTPDQALAIAQHLHLNDSEVDYFMNLVDLDRAATPKLRERILVKLESLKFKSRNFDSSIATDNKLEQEYKVQYYSSWIYAALHIASMIPKTTLAELASRLNLDPQIVETALLTLEKMGLVSRQSGQWQATSKNLHLDSNNFLAASGHRNWREKTIQYLQGLHTQGLHYSGIHALSMKDVEKIRLLLKEAVMSCRKTIDDSPPETLSVFCLDWYVP